MVERLCEKDRLLVVLRYLILVSLRHFPGAGYRKIEKRSFLAKKIGTSAVQPREVTRTDRDNQPYGKPALRRWFDSTFFAFRKRWSLQMAVYFRCGLNQGSDYGFTLSVSEQIFVIHASTARELLVSVTVKTA